MSLTTHEWAGRGGALQARRIRYLIFSGIIAASSLCYCAGFAALSFAPSNRIARVSETATATPSPTVSAGAPTAEATTSTPTQIASPSPTNSPTATPTDTSTPSQTPTLTPTLEPSATSTPTGTPTPTDTPTPTAQPEPITYNLLVAVRGDDRGVFVINQAVDVFPLAPLQLADGGAAVAGSEWGIESLGQEECVSVWRDESNPSPPRGVACARVGASVVRRGSDRFWRSTFSVYYAGELVAQCGSNRCEVSLTVQP